MLPPHSDAILGYGYDLGGPGQWKVREVDDHGRLNLPWLDDEQNFFAEADCRLGDSAGYPEDDIHDSDTFRRLYAEAEARLGEVDIRPYTTPIGSGCLLVAPLVMAMEGTVAVVPSDVLTQVPTSRDAYLTQALGYLGITPTQHKPEWLLASQERFRRC